MSLKDVLGQSKAVEILVNEIKTGNVKHSYIFYGIKGIGKKFTALQFAKSLLCKNKEEFLSCDVCDICKKIDNNIHPDVILVDLEFQWRILEKKDTTTISIDTIRYIKQLSGLSSYEGNNKIFIIDQAETLQKEAANSLLKLLEEPPKNCIFILIVSMLGVLPKTIISRCELIKFLPLKNEILKKILNNHSLKSVFGSAQEINFVDKITPELEFKSILEIQKTVEGFQSKDAAEYFFMRVVEDFISRKDISSKTSQKFLEEIEFFLKSFRYNIDYKLLLETFLMRYSILCTKNL
ncbi:MAG: AAA family ATPase [Endomicrobiia bacterium]